MIPLIILTGPTAVGKTSLSIRLAKAIGGEIISADSVQVYRHMDIGSAKIRPEEMEGIPHHLIDIMDPDGTFDVSVFQTMAKTAISGIIGRGHIPIVVGGTGFYIHALVYDADFDDGSHDALIRAKYADYYKKKGADALYSLLREADPASCLKIHPNNVQRVIRALEYHEITKSTISSHNEEESRKPSPYHFAYFVLTDNRPAIYDRIDRRVDSMVEDGLVKEVESLLETGISADCTSMKALGYKEIVAYLKGQCSLEEAIHILKRDTRHFAKRQLTWFRQERDVCLLDKSVKNEDEILSEILTILKEKGIIHE